MSFYTQINRKYKIWFKIKVLFWLFFIVLLYTSNIIALEYKLFIGGKEWMQSKWSRTCETDATVTTCRKDGCITVNIGKMRVSTPIFYYRYRDT